MSDQSGVFPFSQDIPLQYELAETFTLLDAYHCAINGSTNPNRNFLWTGTTGRRILSHVERPFRTTEEFYYALFDMSAVDRATALSQFSTGRAALSPSERELFDRAMYRSEPDTLVSRLRADISARRLPAVSWLVPTAALSERSGASTQWAAPSRTGTTASRWAWGRGCR